MQMTSPDGACGLRLAQAKVPITLMPSGSGKKAEHVVELSVNTSTGKHIRGTLNIAMKGESAGQQEMRVRHRDTLSAGRALPSAPS